MKPFALTQPSLKTAHGRFAFCALVLLLAAALYLAVVSVVLMRERRDVETDVRLRLVASHLAARVTNALQVGIPLNALGGLEILFEASRARNREIQRIELTDAAGRSLAHAGRAAIAAPHLSAAVRLQQQDVAMVVIHYDAIELVSSSIEAFLLILAAVLAVAIMAIEGARHALGVGPRLRDEVLTAAAARAANGQFSSLFVGAPRRSWDLQPQWLSSAMRRVNEQHVRVRRLVESLRQTEPSAQRRRLLDRLLEQAAGADRFAAGSAEVVRLVPTETMVRWLVLLVSLAVAALRLSWPVGDEQWACWGVALLSTGAACGYRLGQGRLHGMLMFSGALLVTLAGALALRQFGLDTSGLLAARYCGGVLLGAILALVSRLAAPASVSGFVTGGAGKTCAVLAGWIIGGEWLGPVFADLVGRAFGPWAGAVLIPAALLAAVLVVLRWGLRFGIGSLQMRGFEPSPRPPAASWAARAARRLVHLVLGLYIAGLSTGLVLAGHQGTGWNALWWTAWGLGACGALALPEGLRRWAWAAACVGSAGLAVLTLDIALVGWLAWLAAPAVALASAGWWSMMLERGGKPDRSFFWMMAAGAILQAGGVFLSGLWASLSPLSLALPAVLAPVVALLSRREAG